MTARTPPRSPGNENKVLTKNYHMDSNAALIRSLRCAWIHYSSCLSSPLLPVHRVSRRVSQTQRWTKFLRPVSSEQKRFTDIRCVFCYMIRFNREHNLCRPRSRNWASNIEKSDDSHNAYYVHRTHRIYHHLTRREKQSPVSRRLRRRYALTLALQQLFELQQPAPDGWNDNWGVLYCELFSV